jgi:ribosome-associated toxin RatA of RatAB toxin-antitoxin module
MSGLSRHRHLGLLTALAYCTTSYAQSTERYTWEREDSQYGFSIYTSEAPDHGYDALRLIATLDVPLSRVFAKLQDFEGYPSWYYNCRRVQVLQRPADMARVVFKDDGSPSALPEGRYALLLVQRAPPLEDRWAIVRATTTIAGRSVVIEFQSLDAAAPQAPAQGVPMRLRGTWKLTPLTRNRTRVALVIDVDPNVSLPAFVIDPQLEIVAVKIMQGLQRTLQP